MGDQVNLVHRYPVHLLEERRAALTHHDEAFRQSRQFIHDATLLGVGRGQDGMQRGDDRHAEFME